MGAEAALAVLDAKPETAPCVICLDGNKITKRPLMECVNKVHTTYICMYSSGSLSRNLLVNSCLKKSKMMMGNVNGGSLQSLDSPFFSLLSISPLLNLLLHCFLTKF